MAGEPVVRARSKESKHVCGLSDCRVKPELQRIPPKDHRHPIVNRRHEFVWATRADGRRLFSSGLRQDVSSVEPPPSQAQEDHHVWHLEEHTINHIRSGRWTSKQSMPGMPVAGR